MNNSTELILQAVELPVLRDRGIQLRVLREDLHHHPAAGNKWHKLRYNLEAATEQGHDGVLSFGGAWSNHILALAASARRRGLESIGIIRGEAEYAANPLLSEARAQGMRLHFVDRAEYRKRHDPAWQQALGARFGHPYLIPEGGSNALGARGCQALGEQLLTETRGDFDILCCAVGSGGTLAGLGRALLPARRAVGYAVVKDTSLPRRIADLLPDGALQPELKDAARRGYGRSDTELTIFVEAFIRQTGIPIEPVYTGKLFMRLLEDIGQGKYPPGSRLIVLHSGGVWGRHKKAGSADADPTGLEPARGVEPPTS